MKNIKKNGSKLLCVLSVLLLLCGMTACKSGNNGSSPSTGLWDSALYREDTELGAGAKTVKVSVEAEDTKVLFTVHTDKETVGEALMEHDLVTGEDGQYGLFIHAVNGIVADFDKDQHYWAFFIGDEYAATGVEKTAITEGAAYRLVYTK